ncbi:hypothetical protein H072_11238 [Dactylellina haptotyla CBS 200.50]|uniref:Uncharacterized protein n=1 Tax=Dactylellina haptotyla (strain CBS 200.50) TaxID=1284197 RepID=S8BJK9_DACHA|nr:hypothetical protein H072_11238 [Dactylellina haptotyla CBS 200.50]
MEDLRGSPEVYDEEFLDIMQDIDATAATFEDDMGQLDFAEGEEIALLSLALANLPNLESIELGDRNKRPQKFKLTRAEFNILFPSIGMVPGKRLPKHLAIVHARQMEVCELRSAAALRVWNIVLFAAITTPFRKLRVFKGLDQGIPRHWFFLPGSRIVQFTSAFPNLKTLDLAIKDIISPLPVLNINVCNWLRALGANLEDLRIYETGEPRNTTFRTDTILPLNLNSGPSKLKHLSLTGALLDTAGFQEFLAYCKQTLQSLRLKRCRPGKEEKGGYDVVYFNHLKFLQKECRVLKELEISEFIHHEENVRVLLQKIQMQGGWQAPTSVCTVTVAAEPFNELSRRVCVKNIGGELDGHQEASEFWDSLTDGNWIYKIQDPIILDDDLIDDMYS